MDVEDHPSTAVPGSPSFSSSYSDTSSLPDPSMMLGPYKTVVGRALAPEHHHNHHHHHHHHAAPRSLGATHSLACRDGVGVALTDTPVSTAPPSPLIGARSQSSGASTPGKHRATTLDIPGLTRSKVSPDGRIAQRDVGSKLVIVMVGLPARGKSYITKKLARYLNWMQHDTKIFNVGERRRVAAANPPPSEEKDSVIEEELRDSVREMNMNGGASNKLDTEHEMLPPAAILVNGEAVVTEEAQDTHRDPSPMSDVQFLTPSSLSSDKGALNSRRAGSIDQSAQFFDPENEQAVRLREKVALETLDELLDYILEQGGSIGILDATNSTLKRRKAIMDHIRKRAGSELNVLFLESQCLDKELLESNMRLKLSGPDYKDQDPTIALEDFKKRVSLYEKSYISLGDYEEKHNMPFLQMIDVSRKLIAHQVNGFLSSQVMYYLVNFNLSPRQIWICRHGESLDNVAGRIGGDSSLSTNGIAFSKALTRFIGHQRKVWEDYQKTKALSTHFPPRPGDSTPPNPQYAGQNAERQRNFCVWSSMLIRSIQTVQYFDDEEYDVKQMRMLDELNAGKMEGMTYEEIRKQYPEEYANRKREKLHYRYPGPGGEGYLDVINRLKAVIVEVERMTDSVLLVAHRSVARVLLAYFRGLKREQLADLDVPLGVLYMLEPKPYGVEFKAYRYNPGKDWFDYVPDYELRQVTYF
ncbi:hypothetical protein PABG_03520 [Paracoccidioides brasiliensis Pb03]|uniref:Uncharacterized protein n=1 Tax=Paracoccidioides brasiliensis TaxID=121759 RepID=A0A1D2JAH3_PARBR|nr:hypothetical protein PABG_03520 [Paracoccidioides brasiliensis Pb03]ODH23369.1 hypothetical protein ACO22_05387 [Paracoccidioides brasiliensis]ODH52898.1 hypothetical protein GX48_00765 [Paracoccidioides brasiliensis]